MSPLVVSGEGDGAAVIGQSAECHQEDGQCGHDGGEEVEGGKIALVVAEALHGLGDFLQSKGIARVHHAGYCGSARQYSIFITPRLPVRLPESASS
jgi:hypothetical protein